MKKAQASLEYFIIFAVIAGLTLISAGTFLPQVRDSSQELFKRAAGRIIGSPSAPQPSPPQVGDYDEVFNKLIYGTAAYGIESESLSAGQVKRYCIPIDEISQGQDLERLDIDTYSLGYIRGGDISIKLISPSGQEWVQDTPTVSDGSLSIFTKTYADRFPNIYMPTNYPFPYIERGNWILEVKAKEDSNFRIWVRHDKM